MGVGDDAAAASLSELPAVHELAGALDAPHVLAVRRGAAGDRRAPRRGPRGKWQRRRGRC